MSTEPTYEGVVAWVNKTKGIDILPNLKDWDSHPLGIELLYQQS